MNRGLVKNPSRVTIWSQIDNPKGRQPAPHHVIDISEVETPIMSDNTTKADKTGIYKDESGETFVRINEGDLVPAGFTFDHDDETFENQTAEDLDPNVRAMNQPVENRMDSPTENRSRTSRDAKSDK